MEEKIKLLERYNLWGNGVLDLGIYREEYTNKLIDSTGNRLIKVLVGQRRAGKSYILRQLASKLVSSGKVKPQNTLFISREYLDFDFINTYKELDELIAIYKKEIKPEGKVYIFIDEIQTIEGWERLVNSYSQDFTQECEIFISGSNSNMLSGELATLIAGRYITFNIFPFSYNEYLDITKQESTRQSYIDYISGGGLPELFAIETPEFKRNYVSAIKDTVLLKDIIQRNSIKEPKMLEDIFIYLVNNASNLISINSIVKYFKGLGRRVSYEGVSTYLGYIEETFLVHKCSRYDIKGKDTIGGNVKYYINDLAFKNYLYSGYGYGIGYRLENVIYLDLRRAGYDVYIGSIKNKEVDFVAIKGDKTLYVQSTYMLTESSTIEREYSALLSINDNYEKIIVSLDDFVSPINNGIKHIQAWRFREMI